MSNKTEQTTSKKQGLEMKYKVGDLVVPADGSSYVGEITYISQEEDTVRHKCLKTGTEYEKSYYGFPVRYMSIVEMLEWNRKLSKENTDLHTKLILASGGDEAVRAAVANSDACWRMEQEVIVRQRDEAVTARQLERNLASNWMTRAEEADRHRKELKVALANTEAERDDARAEVARLTAQLESVTAENHDRAQREARSLEDWASLRAERDALLVRVDCLHSALHKLLLSRDASWTGGHDWQASVDEAIRALGIEVGE